MNYRLILILTSLIWGVAFVSQRISIATIGPYGFNAVRFLLGAISLLPVMYAFPGNPPKKSASLPIVTVCIITGSVLFIGATTQQIGLIYTTVGKASFITALYIVLVPLLGLFVGYSLRLSHIIGCFTALAGLYLITFTNILSINIGDVLVFSGTIFWASHILLLSYFVQSHKAIQIAFGQFLVCSLWSWLGTFLFETISWQMILNTSGPILYSGILSTGVAYTLQIIGQKVVPPTEASLLLSLEMFFGALSGYFLLGESMAYREIIGCLLLACGVMTAQIPSPIIWQRK